MCASRRIAYVFVFSIAVVMMVNIEVSNAQRMDPARFVRNFVANTYRQASFIRSHFRPFGGQPLVVPPAIAFDVVNGLRRIMSHHPRRTLMALQIISGRRQHRALNNLVAVSNVVSALRRFA